MFISSLLQIFTFVLPRSRTTQEAVIDGLLKKEKPPQVTISNIPGKGGDVILEENVPKGAYITEYKTHARGGGGVITYHCYALAQTSPTLFTNNQ